MASLGCSTARVVVASVTNCHSVGSPVPCCWRCRNLGQVRVGNLQELVYKQGQAGITKATVTLIFNNEDKDQSPVGYEMYDRLTITRQVSLKPQLSSKFVHDLRVNAEPALCACRLPLAVVTST